MTVNGRWKKLDSKTKGYELDSVLSCLFGKGVFVYLYVNPYTKEFRATDDEKMNIPMGFNLFSAGKVGDRGSYRDETETQTKTEVPTNSNGTTTGRFKVGSVNRNQARPRGLTGLPESLGEFE